MRLQRRKAAASLGRARDLRKRPTEAENIVWQMLRRDAFGEHFRRQHEIVGFYLDFYCARLRLGIELDGEGHFTDCGRAYDGERSRILRRFDIHVIRFENRDLIENPWIVEKTIRREIEKRRARVASFA